MNRRLLKHTMLVSLIPLAAIWLSYRFWALAWLQPLLLVGASLVQVAATLLCRRNLQELITPSDAVLQGMNAMYIPAAYEPERFRWDLRVVDALLWCGIPGPLLAFLARAWPFLVPDPGRMVAGVSLPLFFAALLSVLLGAVALGLWARFHQAAAISHEASDRRRYLMRGFAEVIDRPESFSLFLTVRRRIHSAA